jgi:hypothetical protein
MYLLGGDDYPGTAAEDTPGITRVKEGTPGKSSAFFGVCREVKGRF